MKKLSKRLTLRRETLRHLDESNLHLIAAGTPTCSCPDDPDTFTADCPGC